MADYKNYSLLYWGDDVYSQFTPETYIFFKVNTDKCVAAFADIKSLVSTVSADVDSLVAENKTLRNNFGTYDNLDDDINSINSQLTSFKESLSKNCETLIKTAIATSDAIGEANSKYKNKCYDISDKLNRVLSE